MLIQKSRYKEINFSKIYSEGYDSLSSTFINLITRIENLNVYTIPIQHAYRIDLISKTVFNGRTDLFWVLDYLNSIAYIEQLQAGRTLQYPTLQQIEKVYQEAKEKVRKNPGSTL